MGLISALVLALVKVSLLDTVCNEVYETFNKSANFNTCLLL